MHKFSIHRYDKMIYRKCGKWGLKLPAISLSAWETFGGYRGEGVARECVFRAFDLGITYFDFANNYGQPPGNAEKLVGKILKEMPRDELVISSKAGYFLRNGADGSALKNGPPKSMTTASYPITLAGSSAATIS